MTTNLPLLTALAASPERYLLADSLNDLRGEALAHWREVQKLRIKGMLTAYMELDVIDAERFRALCDELSAYAEGQA